jgi:hypothetical protein
MTVGLSAVNYANKILNHMHTATASTAPAGNFVKLHTADPGSAGATAASSVTTRPSATFGAAASGVSTMSNTPSWATWAGTSPETVSHISVWDASTAGTFLYSVALTASKVVQTGDTLTLSSMSVSLSPIAA